MRPTTLLGSMIVGSLLVVAGTARAQTYPPPGGYPPPGTRPPGPTPVGWIPEQHDHEGFFGRVYLGLAYFSSTANDAVDSQVHGGGGAFGIAAGWAVTPNLVVYGELFDDVALGPTFEPEGLTANDDISAGVVGVGGGAAYYFLPTNAFVSGTLSFSQLSIQNSDGDVLYDTSVGPGISLMAGKEWWVGRNTALGVAAQAFLGSQPAKDDDDLEWSTSAFGVVVTASYN